MNVNNLDGIELQYQMLNLHFSHLSLNVLIPPVDTALNSTHINTVTLLYV